jgi:hypothetical protein
MKLFFPTRGYALISYSYDLLSFGYIHCIFDAQLIKITLELSDFIHSMWPSHTYYKIQTLKSHLNIVHVHSMLPIVDRITKQSLEITCTMHIHKRKSNELTTSKMNFF